MNCRENCFILTPNFHSARRGSFRGHREGGRRKVGVKELEVRKVRGGKEERGMDEGRQEGGLM